MNKRLNINKIFSTALILNIIQLASILLFLIFSTIHYHGLHFDNEYILIYFILITVFVNSFNSVRTSFAFMRSGARNEMLKNSIIQVENLNNTLRAQRHDFMNHLQVVYGLIEMDEYKDARDYINKVYNDIQKVSRILKTSNPAVNALLQAKMLDAEKRGITTELQVTSQLRDIQIPAWELCRVLGNLIDNAMDALDEKKEERIMRIEIFEDLKAYGFRVIDNGTPIPSNLMSRIFEAGVTSKGNKGEGMGLAIVKGILTEYDGEIKASSFENQTVFEGKIPRLSGEASKTLQ